MAYKLITTIEIAVGPEVVREKLLDFASIPVYSPNGFVKSITPKPLNSTSAEPIIEEDTNSKNGMSLKAGDGIIVDIERGTFESVVTSNTPQQLTWTGGTPYIFTINHRFGFAPSPITKGYTTFTQEEEFTGMFGWAVGFMKGGEFEREYNAFNRDLKQAVEEVVSGNKS